MVSDHPIKRPAVTRIDSQSVKLSWQFSASPVGVEIFEGPLPGRIERILPVGVTVTEDHIIISHLEPDRPHYFALAGGTAPELIVAERRMPLAGAVNFRDLGGYPAEQGKRIKWGQVFRSDNLARLSGRDRAILRHLDIKTVCDFRTVAETKRSPNRNPESGDLQYLHLPIQHGEHDPAAAFERIKKGDYQWLSEDFMAQGYVLSVDNFPSLWCEFFNTLVSPGRRPFVFHCTGGKDRTGTAAALILSVLGVAEETIVADYALSAGYIAGVLKMINSQLEELGVDPQKVAPYFTVTPSRMRVLLDHIRRTYGSATRYLTEKAGVDVSIIERLRNDLLI